MILDQQPNFRVVFEAGNGQQFFERLAFEPVDVAILDVEMPVMDGLETLAKLSADHPNVRALMLTMHDSDRLINHLMQLGASGFLLKDEEPQVVCLAVEKVANEGVFFRDYVSKALLRSSRATATNQAADRLLNAKLSERELQVLDLICKEQTSKEIADTLYISIRTVEGHRRSLQEKTGAKNLAGLVLYAVRNGMV